MKTRNIFFPLLVSLLLSCGNKKNENVIALQSSPIALGVENNPVNREWIKPGAECYGVVAYVKEDVLVEAKPVKSQIIEVSVRGVKCKALESVKVFGNFGSEKIGIKTNDIWYDLPTDLFKTREEAIAFIEKIKKDKS